MKINIYTLYYTYMYIMLRPFRHFDHKKNSELLVQPRRKDIIHVMPAAVVVASAPTRCFAASHQN